ASKRVGSMEQNRALVITGFFVIVGDKTIDYERIIQNSATKFDPPITREDITCVRDAWHTSPSGCPQNLSCIPYSASDSGKCGDTLFDAVSSSSPKCPRKFWKQ